MFKKGGGNMGAEIKADCFEVEFKRNQLGVVFGYERPAAGGKSVAVECEFDYKKGDKSIPILFDIPIENSTALPRLIDRLNQYRDGHRMSWEQSNLVQSVINASDLIIKANRVWPDEI